MNFGDIEENQGLIELLDLIALVLIEEDSKAIVRAENCGDCLDERQRKNN